MSRPPRTDEGFTLVEMLVAVALLGIAMTAIVSAIMTSIVTSDVHRKQATGENVIRGYAEAAKQVAYSSCATTYTIAYSASAFDFDVALDDVDYWHAPSSTWAESPPADCATVDTVQRLTLDARAKDGRGEERVEVVLRRTT